MQLTGVRCSLSTQHLGHANTYTHAHTHTHTHTHTLSLLCSYVTRSLALHCWCSTWWAVVLPCLPYPSCSWPRPHLRPPRATVMEKTAASLCPSKPRSVSTQRLFMCRVGQNHMYTVYIRYFWQENHQIYGVYALSWPTLGIRHIAGGHREDGAIQTCMCLLFLN